jgi:hypothetical protein
VSDKGEREALPSEVVPFTGTVIDIAMIDRIQTYQVMDDELNTLDTLASEENQALGFFSAMGGALLSLILTALTSMPTAPWKVGVLVALGFVLAIGTLWFGLVWGRARKRRPKLIEKIRGRAIVARTAAR